MIRVGLVFGIGWGLQLGLSSRLGLELVKSLGQGKFRI